MSKELELFQQIVKGYTEMFNMAIHHPKDTIVKWEGVEEIENALKDYELMKQTKIIVFDKKISDDDLEKLKNQRIFPCGVEESKVELLFDEETQKKLKALEIIKKKRVDVSWLHKCFNFIDNCSIEDELDYYNNNYGAYRNSKPLTLEEHKLLREVLL